MQKTVFVGLSGGVDSSVAAALLKEQEYKVVGVYMKNWTRNLPGFACPWKEDYQDAKRVAVQIGIEFLVFDFETQYQQKVVDYMLDEYKAGRTPNPDIMCNQEVKFKLFLNTALEQGADFVATGHYARVKSDTSSTLKQPPMQLLRARDSNKDQSYFLYRVTQKALAHTLFPLGESTKPEVRQKAANYGLVTANKKESMGICFVGKVGIKDFLKQYVDTSSGPIIEQNGVTIGQHDGAIFYTIGQRHGLDVGGGLPYYVVGKNMQKNQVFVTTKLHDERLWHHTISFDDAHWITNPPQKNKPYMVRVRHRAPLVPAQFTRNTTTLTLEQPIKAVTPGQSVVLYDNDVVVGGGIVV